ncbi:3-oxoacyl-[acyl-carrier-protein] reductase FabG [Clostridium felsineum DSM 794]|nr:3-oxoacyl-[acyl-carrier-protein] reductase FabG [Clostridium felsineum DSM 794]
MMNEMKNYFKGKKFLLLGGTSGIGYDIANSLLQEGATVIATGRNLKKLEVLKTKYDEKNIVIKFVDFGEQSSFENFDISDYKLDGLISTVGICMNIPAKLSDYNKVLYSMKVNFLGPVTLINKLIRKKRFNEGSSIVLLSSISGCSTTSVGLSNYSASKAALIGYTRAVALEISPKIRINCVSPGTVNTQSGMFLETLDKMSEESKETEFSRYPLKLGKPEDVSNMVKFLLSPAASWITGQNFIIDGGRTLK